MLLLKAQWGLPADAPYRLSEGESLDLGLGRARVHSAHSGFNKPVSVEVIVSQEGTVESAHAFDGPAGAFREAELAERRLRFKPFLRNGRPVRISFTDGVSVFPLEQWQSPRRPFPKIQNWQSVSIDMERRLGCLQPRCMLYHVQLFPSLKIDLQQGSFGFADPKHFTAAITRDRFDSLVTAFRQADFFSMLDSYIYEHMTDGEMILITFTADGQSKKVCQYYGSFVGAPDSFFALADRIDELTEAKRWNDHR